MKLQRQWLQPNKGVEPQLSTHFPSAVSNGGRTKVQSLEKAPALPLRFFGTDQQGLSCDPWKFLLELLCEYNCCHCTWQGKWFVQPQSVCEPLWSDQG